MIKQILSQRQEFRSNYHYLSDFFLSDLKNDVLSGDTKGKLNLEQSISQAYPLVINISNDLFMEGKESFEAHIISFLFFHTVDKNSDIRIYYGVGHRCDYDKHNNYVGLATPTNMIMYAVIVRADKVLAVTARQAHKTKSQFEKNPPLFMCSYSFLPATPLLFEDSGYIEALFNSVNRETKKYYQVFNSVLESLNNTIEHTIESSQTVESSHLYFLNFLLESEKVESHSEQIRNRMLTYSDGKLKVVGNALTYVCNAGSNKALLGSVNHKAFVLQKLEELLMRSNGPQEVHAVLSLKNHFKRNSGFDSGPINLNQIITKPLPTPIKVVQNEYEVKDFATRPFSLTRIQPISTLLTDQNFELASSYQGSKEVTNFTDSATTPYPILITEPLAKQQTESCFHLQFIAFTLKEAYTKKITDNTMYRYLGYGPTFYFDGESFKLAKEEFNLFGFILKKGQFTNFSKLNYLDFFEDSVSPISISLVGRKPSHALDCKIPSLKETLNIAVKNRDVLISKCEETLVEINESYARFIKKTKKIVSEKSALEYLNNMMQRTAQEEYINPKFSNSLPVIADKTQIEDLKDLNKENNAFEESLNPLNSQAQPLSESDEVLFTKDGSDDSNNQLSNDTDEYVSHSSTPQAQIEPLVPLLNDTVLGLPPIVEKCLVEQGGYDVAFVHTPNIERANLCDESIKNIVELTKTPEKPAPDHYAFNIDRSENFPIKDSKVCESTPTEITDPSPQIESISTNKLISISQNLSIDMNSWSEILNDKYAFKGLNISLSDKFLHILEPNTDDSVLFKIKHILNKSDDYYLLKRAVGKSLAKELRMFIKLKSDQNFLSQFTLI